MCFWILPSCFCCLSMWRGLKPRTGWGPRSIFLPDLYPFGTAETEGEGTPVPNDLGWDGEKIDGGSFLAGLALGAFALGAGPSGTLNGVGTGLAMPLAIPSGPHIAG